MRDCSKRSHIVPNTLILDIRTLMIVMIAMNAIVMVSTLLYFIIGKH